jgi:hypothetical protein
MHGDRDDVAWVALEFERHREILPIATTVTDPRLRPRHGAGRLAFFLSRLVVA